MWSRTFFPPHGNAGHPIKTKEFPRERQGFDSAQVLGVQKALLGCGNQLGASLL